MTTENFNHEWRANMGWAKLVNPVIKTLQEFGCTIFQTKEKFGEFRCYFSGPEDMPSHVLETLRHAVDAVARQSRRTCYECGDANDTRMHTDGWCLPLCEQHSKAAGRNWDDAKEVPGWRTSQYKVDEPVKEEDSERFVHSALR